MQVYSPYVILNKTGLPFNIVSKHWSGTNRPAAGYDMFLGMCWGGSVSCVMRRSKRANTNRVS